MNTFPQECFKPQNLTSYTGTTLNFCMQLLSVHLSGKVYRCQILEEVPDDYFFKVNIYSQCTQLRHYHQIKKVEKKR